MWYVCVCVLCFIIILTGLASPSPTGETVIQHTQITPYNGAKVNFELLKTPDGKLGMANAEVGIFVLVTVGMTLL